MAWLGVEGHDAQVDMFRRALRRGRLASSFLLIGPAGIGKRRFATALAQSLLCPQVPETELSACGRCPSCLQVQAGSHPDLSVVARPSDKAFIPVELLIGDREHRMQEGLCHDLSLRPSTGRRKIAIIDDADYLNEEGANCLLKTLEEPPPGSVLMLIGTSVARQLPTIRSRCQIVRFCPLPLDVASRLIQDLAIVSSAEEAARLASLSEGSPGKAAGLSDQAIGEFQERFHATLHRGGGQLLGFAKEISGFVERAGREGAARRQRLRQIVQFAVEFYHRQLQQSCQTGGDGDCTAVQARLEACLKAQEAIDRNANQATLIEWWLDQLAAAAPSRVE